MRRDATPPDRYYIDTIDARAGLAFISLRKPLTEMQSALPNAPCFYVSPPDFLSHPVIDRALAMGASHHGFQTAVADGDGEIPFRQLEDAVSFVKRCYVRGAASDGSGGDGPGVPPLPDGGPMPPSETTRSRIELESEFSRMEIDSDSGMIVEALVKATKQLNPQKLGRDEAQMLNWELEQSTREWESGVPGSARSYPGGSTMVQVWLKLVTEVFARTPSGAKDRSRRGWSDNEVVGWRRSLLAVLELATSSGLWPCILKNAWKALDKLAETVLAEKTFRELRKLQRQRWPSGRGVTFVAVCHAFLHPGASDHSYFPGFDVVSFAGYLPIGSIRTTTGDRRYSDPWEQFGTIPVPPELLNMVPVKPHGRESLADVMAAVLSDPLLLADRRFSALAVLCSIRIVTGNERLLSEGLLPTSDMKTLSRQESDPSIYRLVRKNLIDKSMAWLQENLPDRVFSHNVEEIIRSSDKLHRGGAGYSPTEAPPDRSWSRST